MGKIIATIVLVILTLGLISYAILGQVAGVKDTGDKAEIEQRKINQMLQDPSVVTGNTVKNYNKQMGSSKLDIHTSGDTFNEVSFSFSGTSVMAISAVKDGALFKMWKQYDVNGELAKVAFQQVDLNK